MLTHIFEFLDEKYWKKEMFLAGSVVFPLNSKFMTLVSFTLTFAVF